MVAERGSLYGRFARLRTRGVLAVTLSLLTGASMLLLGGLIQMPQASAAGNAPPVSQCNPPAFPTGGGEQVTCTITVQNNISTSGARSSVTTMTACLAAAGVGPPAGCLTTIKRSTTGLVSSVNQCNGVVNGGGSNVICDVSVENTVPVGTTASGVTVDECVGSGTGGGTAPTTLCNPTASTSGATVTQCNGSGNGGGASMRVKCTVTGGAMAFPVTVNQCNDSSNGGGSTVICQTTFTNSFITGPTTTTTTTPPVKKGKGHHSGSGGSGSGSGSGGSTGTGSGSTGTGSGSTGTGSGSTGTGSGSGSGSGTQTNSPAVVPKGAPQTGFGGASHSDDIPLVVFGALALLGAGLATVQATRRRVRSLGSGE
jgi:hypothetical protein